MLKKIIEEWDTILFVCIISTIILSLSVISWFLITKLYKFWFYPRTSCGYYVKYNSGIYYIKECLENDMDSVVCTAINRDDAFSVCAKLNKEGTLDIKLKKRCKGEK